MTFPSITVPSRMTARSFLGFLMTAIFLMLHWARRIRPLRWLGTHSGAEKESHHRTVRQAVLSFHNIGDPVLFEIRCRESLYSTNLVLAIFSTISWSP